MAVRLPITPFGNNTITLEVEMEFRIGERDPVTGLYGVIWPDGGVTLNGLKVFNSEHRVGDVVQATERSDGMIILDGLKAAAVTSAAVTSASLSDRRGYLNGQVFNNEDEDLINLSIDLAPNVNPIQPEGGGTFAVRVRLNRSLRNEFRFRVDLSGSATYLVDYAISIDPNEDVIIPAGAGFIDLIIIALNDVLDEDLETVVVSIRQVSRCRVVKSSVFVTIRPSEFSYLIYSRYTNLVYVGNEGSLEYGEWTVDINGGPFVNTIANRTTFNNLWVSFNEGLARAGNIPSNSFQSYQGNTPPGQVFFIDRSLSSVFVNSIRQGNVAPRLNSNYAQFNGILPNVFVDTWRVVYAP